MHASKLNFSLQDRLSVYTRGRAGSSIFAAGGLSRIPRWLDRLVEKVDILRCPWYLIRHYEMQKYGGVEVQMHKI